MARGANKTYQQQQQQTYQQGQQIAGAGQEASQQASQQANLATQAAQPSLTGAAAGGGAAAQSGQQNTDTANTLGTASTLSGLGNEQQAAGIYGQEAENPGYSDAEKANITQGVQGSLAGAFGAARSQLADRASRTGNAAGYGAAEEQLARDQGQQGAQAMGQLGQTFANARIKGQENAAQGLGGIGGEQLGQGLNTESRVGLGQLQTGLGTQRDIGLGLENVGVGTQARLGTGQEQIGSGSQGQMVGNELRYATQPNFLAQVLGGALGTFAGGLGGGIGKAVGGKIGCWVAAAIYGEDDDRTTWLRWWLNERWARSGILPALVMRLYRAIGRQVAWVARRAGWLRRLLRPLFERALAVSGFPAGGRFDG